MFKRNERGQWEFLHGKEAYKEAVMESLNCGQFVEDDEDEQVTEDLKSCYNCQFRRWTMHTFVCLKRVD